jgi:ATP/maltotriose-dependent transcriptional regulator MalT
MNWSLEAPIEDFQAVADRAVEACRQAGNIAGEIEARHVAAYYLWGAGRISEYIDVNQELLQRARSIGAHAQVGAILVRLVPAEEMRGNIAAADPYLTEAEQIAVAYGLRDLARAALMQRSGWFTTNGDVANAERSHRKFLAEAEEAGAVQHQVSALRHLATTLMYQHKDAEAAQCLDRALQLSEASGERWNRSELNAMRARAALEMGDLNGAEMWIGKALETLRDFDVTAVSEVNQTLGVIRGAQGRTEEAEAALRHGLSVLVPTDYLWNQVDPALDLARFLARQGSAEEAKRLVDKYERWANERAIPLWDDQFEEIRALAQAD